MEPGVGQDIIRHMDEKKDAPIQQVVVVSDKVAKFLRELRPEEIEGIEKLARLGPDGITKVLAAVDFWQSMTTVSRFIKWTFIIFGGSVIFVSSVLAAIERLAQNWFLRVP